MCRIAGSFAIRPAVNEAIIRNNRSFLVPHEISSLAKFNRTFQKPASTLSFNSGYKRLNARLKAGLSDKYNLSSWVGLSRLDRISFFINYTIELNKLSLDY